MFCDFWSIQLASAFVWISPNRHLNATLPPPLTLQGPFDRAGIEAHCMKAWGVAPKWEWAAVSFGNMDLRAASNIVFSNGLSDPWRCAGTLKPYTLKT